MRANMPQIIINRYNTGLFATNDVVDKLYNQALQKTGQEGGAHQGFTSETRQAITQAVGAHEGRVEGGLGRGALGVLVGSLFQSRELLVRGTAEERALLREIQSEHSGLGELAEVRERAVAGHGRVLPRLEQGERRRASERVA